MRPWQSQSKRVRESGWNKKNGHSFYGYKNHIIDRKQKLIRRYAETDASVHDSQKVDEALDKSNTSNEVWADSAYRSVETESRLKEKGYKRHGRGAQTATSPSSHCHKADSGGILPSMSVKTSVLGN